MSELAPGISVILPSYKGVELLPRVLTSLANQTLNKNLYEVILVLNGPDDGSFNLVEEFKSINPLAEIRVLQTSQPGASRARNIGLSSVTRQFLTFVDVDDEVESEYLEVALDLVGDGKCALMPIVDISGGIRNPANSLNTRINAYSGSTQLLRSLPWALGFNACKIVPTTLLKSYRYSEQLQSGEDVAFFANLLNAPDLLVSVPAEQDGIAYLRHHRTGSISRQGESFDFSVLQRLQCIAALRHVEVHETSQRAREVLENSQFAFVEKYLKRNPVQVDEAIDEAIALRLTGLDFSRLRSETAKKLVISYCFSPYSDTSANVAAKQIAKESELVDVISANMERVREKDQTTSLIGARYVVRHSEVKVEPSFSSWPLISGFARSALRTAIKFQKQGSPYESMYSRALWSGSHVAAVLVKTKFPSINWQAEFSDPLRKGVDGTTRTGPITWGRTTMLLKRVISRSRWSDIDINTHFELTEVATFIAADELVFTNSNQQQVMLEGYPESLREMVRAKSIIRPHANPAAELFEIGISSFEPDCNKINIGYFGNFYENRGIGPIIEALESMPVEYRQKFDLHVFCNNVELIERMKKERSLGASVIAHTYLPYLDFLATLNEFDVLLVNDVDMGGSKFEVNPFLPSKYSDYSASDASIWGIVSKDSPLDQKSMRFRSYLADQESIRSELCRMLEELR